MDAAPPHAGARLPAGVLGAAFVLLWCTGYPAARIALNHCAPFTLLVLRFGGAGLVFAALALTARIRLPRGAQLLHSAGVGVLSLALQFGCVYFAAARGVNVGLIALVVGTMPIVTALFGLAVGEPVRPLQWLGFVVGFAGVALAVGESIRLDSSAGTAAYLAVLGSLLAVSGGTLYQKRLGSEVDVRAGLTVQQLVAMLVLLPLAWHEGLQHDHTRTFYLAVAWLIGVNSVAAFALFFLLLRRGAVNQVAALFFLMPPVTALLDYVVLGDPFTAYQVGGILLAALGVFLATRVPGLSVPPAAVPRSSPAPGE
ncbi:MAG TPA: DMT family transporter [Steroidobacteraceae bacterium]|nr:DMT family transporter [Steroidobacteraceae bacterium]